MGEPILEPFLADAIKRHHAQAVALSDDLAANPELPDQEFRSSEKIVALLRQAGYQVEYPYLGWPTAFRGVLDCGEGPSAAIMVEYDALPGLGHACGHNVHGSMAVLAAMALADCRDRLRGKVYVFGTPAEEERGGKVIMADQGAFDGMSAAVMVHSCGGGAGTADMDLLSLKCYLIEFTGLSAHAAAAPWKGRNALTAARKFLDLVDARRESFTADTRASGVILDGGKAPNIIPDRALVRFEFRTDSMAKLEQVDRVIQNCARGAALAMDCEVSFTLGFDPFADMVRVPALEREALTLMDALGVAHTDPRSPSGSSDVGNVSYRCPTIQPQFPICREPWATHTPQFRDATTCPPAHQAVAGGGQLMASLVYRVLTDEALRQEIQAGYQASRERKMTL